jgi:ribose 5-phosphate isomerase B
MDIAIANDHAGYELKVHLSNFLKSQGYKIIDMGTHSADSVDYPDFAHALSTAVEKEIITIGILICGSGNGVCISANKHKNVRAALAWNSEIARLAKQHNNANVLCLPGRFITENEAEQISIAFLHSEFEGGRHERRVNKIDV